MSKPKILIVIGNLGVGGTEWHLLKTLPLLTSEYDITIYTISFPGKLACEFAQHGIHVISPDNFIHKAKNVVTKAINKTISFLRFFAHLSKTHYDIIHFYLLGGYVFGGVAAKLLGRKNLIMSRRCLNYYQKKRCTLAFIEKKLHRSMAYVLANSKRVAEQLLEEGVQQSQLQLIYNGVNPDRYNLDKNHYRTQLGLNPQSLIMTIVANLFFYKGHADLLNALALIKNQLPNNWQLLCVGRDEGELDKLKLLSKQLKLNNHIQFLGQRSDIPELMAASDIGLLCSHEEGFSNAILEFMASSKPMVVTDVGGNAEAIVDGKCGYVVPAKNPQVLAAGILKLVKNLAQRQQFGLAARNRVIDYFTLDKTASEYHKIYQTIVNQQLLPAHVK